MKSLFAAFVLGLVCAAPVASAQPVAPPDFTYDTNWMQTPPQYVLGDISGVAIDRADNVWVLHRPRTLAADQLAKAAPPVLQFDKTGKFIRAWGGAGAGYDWPANEHTIFVDDKNRVWITGNSRAATAGDDAILTFTPDGRFIRQIGKETSSKGDLDTENVKAAADLFIDTRRREMFVADGYTNRRVIVFDSETGRFKRMWGAFGNQPPSTPASPAPPARRAEGTPEEVGDGPPDFRTVHGVEVARDGTVYVSDRDNHRVQLFDRNGRYITQVFINRNAPSRQTAAGIALSADRAQRWLYVIDLGNCHLEILDRKTLQTVKSIGQCGTAPGQFTLPHLMAVNSKGVVYVAEVSGRRVQRLTPK